MEQICSNCKAGSGEIYATKYHFVGNTLALQLPENRSHSPGWAVRGTPSGGCLTSICLPPSAVLCARTTVKQSQSLTGSCLVNVKYFYIHQNTPKQLKKLFISRFPLRAPQGR